MSHAPAHDDAAADDDGAHAAIADAHDEPVPEEPKTPLWLTALGGGLFFLLAVGWLLASDPSTPNVATAASATAAAPPASAPPPTHKAPPAPPAIAAPPPPIPAPPPPIPAPGAPKTVKKPAKPAPANNP